VRETPLGPLSDSFGSCLTIVEADEGAQLRSAVEITCAPSQLDSDVRRQGVRLPAMMLVQSEGGESDSRSPDPP
jgi:hypothetical protein